MAKIDININNIFYQLHEAAVEQAQTAAPDLVFYNTGVDEEKQEPAFMGSGQYFVCAAAKNEKSVPDTGIDKSTVFSAIKKYVEFFCGAESANVIKEDQLEPIEVGQKIKRKRSNPEDSEEENVDESLAWKHSLLDRLFEHLDEDDSLNEADAKKIIGYLLPYQASIKGEKPKPPRIGLERLGKHLKNVGHSLLFKAIPSLIAAPFSLIGKALGSFDGIVVKTGSGDFNTKLGLGAAGKASEFAAKGIKKGGELAAKGYAQLKQNFTIDLSTIESDITRAFDQDFPNNEVHVKVYKTSTLTQILKKQGKFSKKIEAKFSTGSEYCIGIIVGTDDINYDSYDKEVIANEATKGVANQNDSMFSGKITKDMILKVAGYGSKSKSRTKKIVYEGIKTPAEVCLELTRLLFEAGAVTSDPEALKFVEKSVKIIEACPDKDAFWTEFETNTTIPDADIATKTLKTKSDFRGFFESGIRRKGISELGKLVRSKFESSKKRAQAFFKLVKAVALKLHVKLPADIDPKSDRDISVEKIQDVQDMYIIVRKRMKYVDADEKGGKK